MIEKRAVEPRADPAIVPRFGLKQSRCGYLDGLFEKQHAPWRGRKEQHDETDKISGLGRRCSGLGADSCPGVVGGYRRVQRARVSFGLPHACRTVPAGAGRRRVPLMGGASGTFPHSDDSLGAGVGIRFFGRQSGPGRCYRFGDGRDRTRRLAVGGGCERSGSLYPRAHDNGARRYPTAAGCHP